MKPKGNSIKENIDAMCKSLGFKKDRKSGHYMREVTPGLEDSIHFFFKPYWFFRNLVEAQVAEDHFPFEQVKRCSPKHYSLYSF